MQKQADNEHELTARQQLFVAELVKGVSVTSAASAIGIAERTARYWLSMAHVRQAVEKAKDEQFNAALALLQQATGASIRTLIAMMRDEQASSIRLRAAQILFEKSLEVRKVNILEQRIEQLETLLKAKDAKK